MFSLRPVTRTPRRNRRLGQSLVEFALVAPLLLLVFAAAADLGRAFYGYVAVENAAKEGAFYGSRVPLCDDDSAPQCAGPNNVKWRVQNELDKQRIFDASGNKLVPTTQCLAPGGAPRATLADCTEGDTYSVSVTYPYKPLTPIIGSMFGTLNLNSTSKAVVLNLAFDPTPGASIQKFVSPTGAKNGSEVIAKCLEPDDSDANGFYRSPCLDSSTPDPTDRIKLKFEQGATIAYRLVIGNSGGQSLSGVTVTDSTGATGCAVPSTMAVGYGQVCNYNRTAPNVSGSGTSSDFVNIGTIDSAQTLPAVSDVTVTVEKPPAKLQVVKWESPFKEGGSGDGNPNFGFIDDLSITYSTQIPSPSVWFKVAVTNTGGQPATGIAISDSLRSFPVNADCPARPSTLNPGAVWICRYQVTFNSSSPATTSNTASATAANVTPDGDDSHTAIVRVSQCTGTNRTVPNLIGLGKSAAVSAWTAAGFTSTLSTWSGSNGSNVATQSRQAFTCIAQNSTMSVTR